MLPVSGHMTEVFHMSLHHGSRVSMPRIAQEAWAQPSAARASGSGWDEGFCGAFTFAKV